jgi:glycosyltransferase involved in cell wall biosynthesis
MRVAYVTDSFAKRERFGLSRVAHELRDALSAGGVEVLPVSACSDFGGDEPDWLKVSGFRRLPVRRKHLAPLWSYLPEPRVERWTGPVDVVHGVDIDYAVATRRPWVLTIHDLGPLERPEFFTQAHPWLVRRMLAQAVKRAAAVMCISETTAAAVRGIVGPALDGRLSVIPLGLPAEQFTPPAAGALTGLAGLPPAGEPFFLFTGSMNPRKNLPRIVRAFAAAAGSIPHHLVLAGSLGWDFQALEAEIAASPIAGRIHRPGYVTDDQLKALYAAADGYIYVSLYEGFGLPIIEAMAQGCPVLTSDRSSMPDVAGGAALLVDPENEEAIAEKIIALAENGPGRADRVARGLAHAASFSWTRTAAQVLDVYRAVR